MLHPLRPLILNVLVGYLIGFFCCIITPIMEYWRNNPSEWTDISGYTLGFATSSLYYGAAGGNLISSAISRFCGPRTMIFIGAIAATVGSGWSVGARYYYDFVVSRAISGVGLGMLGPATSNWITEMSFPDHRGFVQTSLQLAIAVAALGCSLGGYLLQRMGDDLGWRYMLAMGPPACILLCIFVAVAMPESAAYLRRKKSEKSGVAESVAALPRESESSPLIGTIQDAPESTPTKSARPNHLLEGTVLLALTLINQFSGVTALSTYGPRIFEKVGIKDPLRITVFTSGWAIFACGVATLLIERMPRRKLYFTAVSLQVVSLIILTVVYICFSNSTSPAIVPLMLGAVFLFGLTYNVGGASMYGVLIAEVLSRRTRAVMLGAIGAVLWIIAAVALTFFPVMFATLHAGGVFALYLFVTILAALVLLFTLPETRGLDVA